MQRGPTDPGAGRRVRTETWEPGPQTAGTVIAIGDRSNRTWRPPRLICVRPYEEVCWAASAKGPKSHLRRRGRFLRASPVLVGLPIGASAGNAPFSAALQVQPPADASWAHTPESRSSMLR